MAENVGQPGKYSDPGQRGSWEENAEAIQFVTWWNRVKNSERFYGYDADGNVVKGLLNKYDPYTLYPVFYEYAAFRMIDCSYARLWSMIRSLSGWVTYPHYPFYKVWLLYWKVLWGVICGDKQSGHRLEFAMNYGDLQKRPLMLFIRTLGIRYHFLRKRISTRLEMRRIWVRYHKHAKLSGNERN